MSIFYKHNLGHIYVVLKSRKEYAGDNGKLRVKFVKRGKVM